MMTACAPDRKMGKVVPFLDGRHTMSGMNHRPRMAGTGGLLSVCFRQ